MTSPGGRKILVVDDSPIAVTYLSLLLRKMGFRVVPARDGIEALRLIRTEAPAMVLLDLKMPMMDGMSVLKALRKAVESPPVVISSVVGDAKVREECFALGCKGYLRKPVSLADLHEQILSCIRPPSHRRRHLRAPFGRAVSVMVEGEQRDCYAVTLSEGGIYLRMNERLPVGHPVSVTLLPENEEPLTLHGKVIYRKDVFGEEMKIDPGVGILFSKPNSTESVRLGTMVRRLLAGDLLQDAGALVLDPDDG